jgi:hypothetical protein
MVVIQMEECVGQCAMLRSKMAAILASEKAPIADQIAEMEALVVAHAIVQQEPLCLLSLTCNEESKVTGTNLPPRILKVDRYIRTCSYCYYSLCEPNTYTTDIT